MLVTIANCGDGKCVWCQTAGEGVQATFKDGLSGFLCRKDFWTALKARSGLPPASGSDAGGGASPGPKLPAR